MQSSNKIQGRGIFQHALLIITLFIIGIGCRKDLDKDQNSSDTISAAKNGISTKDFNLVSLVGDNDEYDPLRIDPLMINGWGIAFSATGTAWISAEGSGTSAVYDREGNQVLAAVSIPSPGAASGGHPTGQVFNSGTGFLLPNGNPARFIFDGLDGVISGWNGGNVEAAIKMIDNSGSAVYTGLAIAADPGGGPTHLFAANFSQGRIDVYNDTWAPVVRDFTDPSLPEGYSPFNIQEIGGWLYVLYAKVDINEGVEEVHPGYGIVSVFQTDGSFVKRLVTFGKLNAPWGIAKSPAGFLGEGTEPAILIGNFGDGKINAYSMEGEHIGQLRSHGAPIVIEGLWAITFPPSTSTIDPNRLYFAAGPDDELHGLFGYISK